MSAINTMTWMDDDGKACHSEYWGDYDQAEAERARMERELGRVVRVDKLDQPRCIIDNTGRVGKITEVRNGAVFAKPLNTDYIIRDGRAGYITVTAWHLNDDGLLHGCWYDSPLHTTLTAEATCLHMILVDDTLAEITPIPQSDLS